MKRKRLLFAAIALVAGALNINAQEEDYTSYLTNPDMSSKEGWTMVSHYLPNSDNPDVFEMRGDESWGGPTGLDGYKCMESYAGWGRLEISYYSMTQNITLPSGKYRAESNAFYRYGLTWGVNTGLSYAYFIATTPEANFKQIIPTLGNATDGAKRVTSGYANNMDQASEEFAAGNYKSTIEFALEGESEVTFGYEGTHVLKQSWFISGPIKLYRVGDFDYSAWDTQIANAVAAINGKTLPTNAKAYVDGVVAEYNKTYQSVAAYNEAIEVLSALAEAIDPLATAYASAMESYPIPAVAAQALAAAVTSADGATYASIDDLNAQVDPLYAAVAEAKAWIEPYAAFNVAKTDIQALYDVAEYEELVEGAHEALGAALSAGDKAETIDQLILAADNLKAAGIEYAGKANPTGEAKFDLTFMLTNPDVTEYWDGTWGIQPEGWYEDQNIDGDNFQVMANNNMGLNGEVFMEYWFWNAATSGYVLYQKVTLPEGAYQMTGRLAVNFDNQPGTVANVTFSANDVDGTQIAAGTLQDASVEFINKEEQEVKIGMKAHEGNQARWMAINKIHLYKIAPKPFEISENETYDNTQSGAGNVELTRTIKEGLNTVVLPFQMSAEDIVILGGEGAVAYTVAGIEGTSLKLAKAESVLANVPFFLKATAAGSEFFFEDKTIVAGEPVATVGVVQAVGTYEAITVPTMNNCFILSNGKFYGVDSEVSLKPTRAYIKVTPTPEEVKVLTVDVEDATAIEAIESTIANAQVYDLSGRKVQSPTRGLYIANGKKVLVK